MDSKGSNSDCLPGDVKCVSTSLKVKNWNRTFGSLLLLKIYLIYLYFRIFFVLILSRLMFTMAYAKLGSTICTVVSEGSTNQMLWMISDALGRLALSLLSTSRRKIIAGFRNSYPCCSPSPRSSAGT